MAKKTKISEADIIAFYMDDVVEHQVKPNSIEDFAKSHQFDDVVFYEHFTSFKDLEKTIYLMLFQNSVVVLKQSTEYHSYSKKDKLLSLYYTFFENLALNKEYIRICLKGFENQLQALSDFSRLKRSFTDFIEDLNLETFSLNVDTIETIQNKTIKESAWLQFLFVFKFWLDDTSEDFEKTDMFIEKSIITAMDLLDTTSLHNIIDLAKFIYKEKVK
ncbi:TetR family transcriptional regulator C-terminal domain-containing protein [Winogradskyella ursingii]|uniref:TetR family transcriptional regulator C-terminal domain-containing protein n=1 Tax=Winogradskyella ursingii TaxID=2686079 RepID=UPI0015CC51C7|nr:TetR family transcriptional regulator C-terminal domain-containing protein [Winogradskyella ursingii]